jgi:ADP-heptose:LPS heptosyltransferase
MFNNFYKDRVRTKFTNYRQGYNFLLSSLFIVFYVIRDGMISTLMWVANKFISSHQNVKKEVIFLESRQQGYGDLLFQTPIFEALSNAGYKVDVIILKKHLPIIEGNPHIEKVYFWDDWLNTTILPLRKGGYVIFLGRNTIIETIFGLMFYKSEKIILDKNLEIWKDLFSQNHTLAWQKLIKNYLDKNIQFNKPKIYAIPKNQKNKSSHKKKVAVIVGVNKKYKRYEKIILLINLLRRRHNLEIYLIGVCDEATEHTFKNYHDGPYKNLLNKQGYLETIQLISSVNVVIGTEGSLIHVSTTLGVPTLVIEGKNKFWRYSNLKKTDNIIVISKNKNPEQILQALQPLLN